jgi:DNA-nicking Smr family endonuclease
MRKPSDEDVRTFRDAVKGARPLRSEPRIRPHRPKPKPRALFRRLGEAEVLEDSLQLTPADLDVEFGDELTFRRGGIQDAVMRRLRRGHYRVESELDLHGLTVPEAKQALRDFLARGPVIKQAVNVILRRTDPVIAFCSARQVDGGTGAIYVLLQG